MTVQLGVPTYFFAHSSRGFYITYKKMKEIGPIPRKLWPFYDFFGSDTLPTVRTAHAGLLITLHNPDLMKQVFHKSKSFVCECGN